MRKLKAGGRFLYACAAMPFVFGWFIICLLRWKYLVFRTKASLPDIDQSAD